MPDAVACHCSYCRRGALRLTVTFLRCTPTPDIVSCLTLREGLKVSSNGRKRSPLTQVPRFSQKRLNCRPSGTGASFDPPDSRSLERDFAPVARALGSTYFCRPSRSAAMIEFP